MLKQFTPEELSLAKRVVDQMYNHDPFSLWLGIVRLEDAPGRSVLQMTVRKEMLNGFSILHGGITYSLADSALAFASNAHGIKAVSIETSISHVEPCREGDVLTAIAEEKHISNRTGVYYVTVYNQEHKQVALFKGTVYRTGKLWFPEENQ
ncbi:MAG: hotdog fold thioesterase [Flavobacteriales bacterium]|nr:hotdog fold thioesterase [Flavobacteriales bacterium]